VLKSPDTPHCLRVALKVAALEEGRAKVLAPRGEVEELTRTPVTVIGKTTHNGFIEIQLVQLILGRQIPVAVTV